MLARLSEAYRKLRNTFRYCLGNLYDFDPAENQVDGDRLEEIDAWALMRTAELLERVRAAYDEYSFHKVYRAIYDYATVDLSSFYFDILKDRLYTAPARSVRRRAAQTVLYRIADALVRALAPLMCFTADEVWSQLPEVQGRQPSVHLETFVAPESLRALVSNRYRDRLENWPRLVAVRNEVLKALEAARQSKFIGGSLEGKVGLTARGNLYPLLQEYCDLLPTLFIVSQVELSQESFSRSEETQLPELRVRIEKATGKKCARCWNFSEQVGEDARYPLVCERCSAALKEIEATVH
jgi:isoleucyl-tRNA synthetase